MPRKGRFVTSEPGELTRERVPEHEVTPTPRVGGREVDPDAPAEFSVSEADIADLIPDPNNTRRHNPRNIGMIETAIGRVGTARSVVLNADNMLLAGNGAVEAAIAAGIRKVLIIDQPGDVLVAVRRRGLSPEDESFLSIADNRATDLSDFDPAAILAEAMKTGAPLAGLFSDAELSVEEARRVAEAGASDDEPPQEEKQPPKKRLIAFRLEFTDSLQKSRFERVRKYLRETYPEQEDEADRFLTYFADNEDIDNE